LFAEESATSFAAVASFAFISVGVLENSFVSTFAAAWDDGNCVAAAVSIGATSTCSMAATAAAVGVVSTGFLDDAGVSAGGDGV